MNNKIELQILVDSIINDNDLNSFDKLYNKYYYIAKKSFKVYEGTNKEIKAKELAHKILKEAISLFCDLQRTNDKKIYKYNLSNYIHKKFANFDSKMKNIDKIKVSVLESEAYKNNYKARLELFKRKLNLIKIYGDKLYNRILTDYNKEQETKLLKENFCYYQFTQEDIYQDYCLYTWKILNQYYNKSTRKVSFSIYLARFLNLYTDHMFHVYKDTEKLKDKEIIFDKVVEIYDALETKEEMELVLNLINNDEKILFEKHAEGESFRDIALAEGVTRQCIQQRMQKASKRICKQIGKYYD